MLKVTSIHRIRTTVEIHSKLPRPVSPRKCEYSSCLAGLGYIVGNTRQENDLISGKPAILHSRLSFSVRDVGRFQPVTNLIFVSYFLIVRIHNSLSLIK